MLIGADLERAALPTSDEVSARLGHTDMAGGYQARRLLTGHVVGVRLWSQQVELSGDATAPAARADALVGNWPFVGAAELMADTSGAGRHAVLRFAGVASDAAAQPTTAHTQATSTLPVVPLSLYSVCHLTAAGFRLFGDASVDGAVRWRGC